MINIATRAGPRARDVLVGAEATILVRVMPEGADFLVTAPMAVPTTQRTTHLNAPLAKSSVRACQDRAVSIVYDCTLAESRGSGLVAAANAVRAGGLVVLPTDTVYGLGADAFDPSAVGALLSAKGRGRDMPVPVLVGSWSTVDGLVSSVPRQARTLIEAFWPGGLSLVLPQAASLAWDLGDTRGTVNLRMPLHPVALELLREVGPMAVSSANRSGHAPASTATEARDQLGESVSVYLDAGDSGGTIASTIVDLTQPRPRVLREGAVSLAQLSEALGTEVIPAR